MTRILKYDDLDGRGIAYSKCQLWRLERADKFPKRVRLGARRYGWVEAEIEAYLQARIAQRDGLVDAA